MDLFDRLVLIVLPYVPVLAGLRLLYAALRKIGGDEGAVQSALVDCAIGIFLAIAASSIVNGITWLSKEVIARW